MVVGRFACLALAVVATSPVSAQPFYQWGADGTLQVVVDEVGSVAVEVAITTFDGSGLEPATAEPADPLFDQPTPGANPIVGEITSGLYSDGDRAFISYGSDVLTPGTYDLWRFIQFDGGIATGLIAQRGVMTEGLVAETPFHPGFVPGDADLNGFVTAADITAVLSNFGATSDGPGRLFGDADGSGSVTAADITSVLTVFNGMVGVAVPEPASIMAALMGVLVGLRGRSR